MGPDYSSDIRRHLTCSGIGEESQAENYVPAACLSWHEHIRASLYHHTTQYEGRRERANGDHSRFDRSACSAQERLRTGGRLYLSLSSDDSTQTRRETKLIYATADD